MQDIRKFSRRNWLHFVKPFEGVSILSNPTFAELDVLPWPCYYRRQNRNSFLGEKRVHRSRYSHFLFSPLKLPFRNDMFTFLLRYYRFRNTVFFSPPKIYFFSFFCLQVSDPNALLLYKIFPDYRDRWGWIFSAAFIFLLFLFSYYLCSLYLPKRAVNFYDMFWRFGFMYFFPKSGYRSLHLIFIPSTFILATCLFFSH